MKKFIAIAFTLLFSLSAQAIIVIGDSISTGETAWPTYLDDNHGYYVAQYTQPVRAAYTYDIPPDLFPYAHSRVIYFLGTNDMAFIRTFGLGVGVDQALRIHISTLVTKGFEVLVIIPTPYPNYGIAAQQVRGTLQDICYGYAMFKMPVKCIDAQEIWDYELTTNGDEIHPLPELSVRIADWVAQALADWGS